MPLVIKTPSIIGKRMRSLASSYTSLSNFEGSQEEFEVANNKDASWESMPALPQRSSREENRLAEKLAHITAECYDGDNELLNTLDGSVASAVIVVPSNGETSEHLNIEFLHKSSSSSSSCSTTESLETSSQHTATTKEQEDDTKTRKSRWSLPIRTISTSFRRVREASSQRLSRPLSCGNLLVSRTASARIQDDQRLSMPLLSKTASASSYKRFREAPNQRSSRPLAHYGAYRASYNYCPME